MSMQSIGSNIREQLSYHSTIICYSLKKEEHTIDIPIPNTLHGEILSDEEIINKNVSYLIQKISLSIDIEKYFSKKTVIVKLVLFNGETFIKFLRPISGLDIDSSEMVFQKQNFLDFEFKKEQGIVISSNRTSSKLGTLYFTNLPSDQIVDFSIILSGFSRSNVQGLK